MSTIELSTGETISVTVTGVRGTGDEEREVAVTVRHGLTQFGGDVSVEADGSPVGDSAEMWVSPNILRTLATLPERDQTAVLAEIQALAAAKVTEA